jgi:DNA-binding response OmpR family regulator
MKKVLIVEENPFIKGILSVKLKSEGYTVLVEEDNDKALEAMDSFRPDIVLIDLTVNESGGFDVLKGKQEGDFADTPVIAIIPKRDAAHKESLKEHNVGEFLVQDEFSPSELLLKVESVLKHAKPVKEKGKGKSLAGKKIMWVEDDSFLSSLIGKKLKVEGALLTHTSSGEKALEMIEDENPDLMLLDILLPGENGLEILERVRDTESVKDVPVILLSNYSQNKDMEKGAKLGVKKFLVKAAVSMDEIVEEIERALD